MIDYHNLTVHQVYETDRAENEMNWTWGRAKTGNDRRTRGREIGNTVSGFTRVDSIKVLGVTFSRKFSVSQHVHQLLAACSQSLFALRILRQHGLLADALHVVFQAIVANKLLYASPAWWGFASADDRGISTSVSKARLPCHIDDPRQYVRRCWRPALCQTHLQHSTSSTRSVTSSTRTTLLSPWTLSQLPPARSCFNPRG